jgi:hypothetical protein
MTMTPIHRIPRDTRATLTELIDAEGANWGIAPALQDELDHIPNDGDDKHATIMLDWAMQLRAETGRSWGECIRTAQVLYYG